MAVEQPAAGNALNTPDHSIMHRVVATDASAAVKSLTVESDSSKRLGDGVTNYLELSSTGDAVFVGSAGMAYASIYVKATAATVSVDSDNPDTLVTQWGNNGESNNATADQANDKITITKKGRYLIMGSFSVSLNGGATVTLRIEGYLNGNIQAAIHSHITVSSTDINSISISGIINVGTVPWDLDIRANINSATARDLTVEDANLSIVQIGG